MCLAVPGKILSINDNSELKMAKVDFGGVQKYVCVEWIDIEIGEYVLVHAGMAISKIDHDEALRSLSVWEELLQKTDKIDVDDYE